MKPTTSPLGLVSMCALFLGALLSSSQAARAEFLGSAVSIQFWTGSDLGSYDLTLPIPSDPWAWQLDAPIHIYSASNPGKQLATIDSLSLELDGDPAVSLSFAVTAGAVPTLISVSSSTVVFAPIDNADAFATAAISLTDGNGNGAWVTGALPSGKSYEAHYDGGSLYAGLISGVAAGPDASSIVSERVPVTGTNTIPGSITSIQSQFGFVLSAYDSASGTSRFQVNIPGPVVPEPSTWVLAGLGLMGWAWFGRRRVRR